MKINKFKMAFAALVAIACLAGLAAKARAAECVVTADAQDATAQNSLYAMLMKAKSGQCATDGEGRQIVKVNVQVQIGEHSNLIKYLKDEFTSKILLEGASQSNGLYCKQPDGCGYIAIRGNGSKLSNIRLDHFGDVRIIGNNVGLDKVVISYAGDCIRLEGTGSVLLDNNLMACGRYGFYVTGAAASEISGDVGSTKKLMCLNKIMSAERYTNLMSYGSPAIDDYTELKLTAVSDAGQTECDKFICGNGGTFADAVCSCLTGYQKDASARCTICNNAGGYFEGVAGSGVCELCDGTKNKEVKNGQCACKTGYSACQGACMQSCPGTEFLDENTCLCKSECGVNATKTETGCVCNKDHAKYNALATAECAYCDVNYCDIQGNKCVSNDAATWVVDIYGKCVPKSGNASPCGDPNAEPNSDGLCECKACYYWVNDAPTSFQPACRAIPDCEPPKLDCSLPENQAALDCSCDLPENAGQSYCGMGKGDCGCMLYSVPKTELQVILPYIVGTLGVAGMFVWRRKRGK